MKNFIKNFLLEQDENLVSISPQQYLEILENVGGVADRISKLKPYRGKGIVITGPINLSDKKNIGPLTGVVRIMGRLDISGSNIPTLDGITVDGYVSDYGSTMWRTKKQKELNEKLDSLDEKRRTDEWDVENGDDESERTEALYMYLDSTGDIDTVESDDGGTIREDKYYIYPSGGGNYGYGREYEWLGGGGGFDPKMYVVYHEDEVDSAAKEAIGGLIDDVGYGAFPDWVWEDAIDEKYWEQWLEEFFNDYIYGDPESFDIPLTLSKQQETQVSQLNKSIEVLRNKIKNDVLTDEERNKIIVKITGLEQIIKEINEDPEGDSYDEDAIEREVGGRVDYYKDDIKRFMDDFGYESDRDFITNFIDTSKLTETVINSDGYGSVLNSYDGDYESYNINGSEYYVMRSS
jgi:hypothetical protein